MVILMIRPIKLQKQRANFLPTHAPSINGIKSASNMNPQWLHYSNNLTRRCTNQPSTNSKYISENFNHFNSDEAPLRRVFGKDMIGTTSWPTHK
ncbi:hypothetical protein DVH24_021570 [Malus domestica]|uniref:Uncharacterized protein n=1 Tax=Malus domestica TaxID=3750 RepID=A0A498JV58_MALDO|nr:hypothetical protein DVH24_021570 [Malus domestica]